MLVFALGLMSVSPAMHQWVHAAACEHADGHAAPAKNADQPFSTDHGCAVVWFSHGLTVAADVIAPDRTPEAQRLEQFRAFEELRLSRTASLLPPGRAPPQV